jgi:DNA-3-methyladenine glycosylase II
VSHEEATEILAARDPVLAGLVAEAGPMRIPRRTMSPFAALVQAIVYQQLAGAAARAIHGRLIAALDGVVAPEALLGLSDETLRAVGLSTAKVRSLRDLATKSLDGAVVLSPRALARQSDDEVIARLSSVRGIGPWSAQMFLIFQLRQTGPPPAGSARPRRASSPPPRGLRRSTRRRPAASRGDRRRLRRTSWPSSCSGGITLLKHEPSAQLPWQKTMLGSAAIARPRDLSDEDRMIRRCRTYQSRV